MFFFFGITPRISRRGYVLSFCQVHGGQARHELASYRSWFKLFFFLPLFPVGRERLMLTCTECGAAYQVSREEAQQLPAYSGPATDQDFGYGDADGAMPAPEPARRIQVRSRRLDRRE